MARKVKRGKSTAYNVKLRERQSALFVELPALQGPRIEALRSIG